MSTEELTELERELERLKKGRRGGFWKFFIAGLIFFCLMVFLYDLFQDLETQKALVSKYKLQLKKLEIENQNLKEELSRCRQGLTTEEGPKDGGIKP